MRVNLYATFRLIANAKTVQIDLPAGSSVRQVVKAVVKQLPVLRPHWLDRSGELHAHVHIFINGEDVAALPENLDTPLPADAVLDFFPPVAGGE